MYVINFNIYIKSQKICEEFGMIPLKILSVIESLDAYGEPKTNSVCTIAPTRMIF